MSAEALAAPGVGAMDLESAHRRARIYRLACGMTLSSGVAFGLAWPLSFLTPVLAAKLLSLPKVMPFKASLGFVAILSGAFTLSTWLLLPTLRYPAVHLLVTGLILFLLFYAKAGGTNPLVVVFLLIATLVVPLIGTLSESLAIAVSKGLIFATVVAVIMTYVAAAAFPDPPGLGPTVASASQEGDGGEDEEEEKEEEGNGPPSPRFRTAMALRSLVVLYPIVMLFQMFSMADFAVVLIFASLLTLEPTYGKHFSAGKGLVLANLAGGLVAVVIYELLVMVPAFTFLLLIILLAGLWVGGWIFSDRPLGKLLGGGITTLFIVLGPTLTGDAQAAASLFIRLFMIMGAVVYVVVAFGLLERLTRGRRITA